MNAAVRTAIAFSGDGEPTTSSDTLGWDELPRDFDRATKLSLGEIKIGGKTYVCQTHLVKTSDESGAPTETKWFYCPDQSPYLLKRITRAEGEKILGEDYYFCERAREAGFEIWCDGDLSRELAHIGQKAYG